MAGLRPAWADSVFAYAHDGKIYLASAADGSNRREICRGDDPCLSNNGRFLAYTRTEKLVSNGKTHGQQDAPARTIIVREISGGKEAVLQTDGATQAYGALWSPDDQWIAFNVYDNKTWQVAVSHPDGTLFHILSGKFDASSGGYFLAGWNMHEGAILAQNLATMVQVNPMSGEVAWQQPVKQLTGEESTSSGLRCTISTDGKMLVATRYVEKDEFKNLDGPSSYLVLANFPEGKPKRMTPPKFDVATPWLDSGGEFVLLRGFYEKDVTSVRGTDGVKLRTRIYRYGIHSGELKAITKEGESPSASSKTE